MKRFFLILLIILLCSMGCSSPKLTTQELVIFAAASLEETLTEIGDIYESSHPDVKLIFNFDSSGTLKTQIAEGADCDLFFSASKKPMDQLSEQDFLLEGTLTNLLENRVVLAVPEGNPADIRSFEDLGTDKLTLLAIGNEDVPVGSYSLEILSSLNLLQTLEDSGKITYGTNAKEVTTQVSEEIVDAGILYATDAFSAGLTVVDLADESLCSPVIYPAAVLKGSDRTDLARDFLVFLTTSDSADIFRSVGFYPLFE